MDSNKKYNIGDVAKMLGVSRATVSRALSGAPGVGDELRNKIISFADSIGYKPSTLARSLSRGRMDIIGLVFGDVRNPFYADLTFYIQKELENYGYTVMLFNSEYDAEKEIDFLRTAGELCLAGLILFTAQNDMKRDQLEKLNMPVVFVNRTLEWQDYDCVLMDNFKAGYIAAMHLIEEGHRRIGFVGGQALSSASRQRFEGFKKALDNHSVPLYENDLFSGDLKMETGYELADSFFKNPSRPTGLVIANDLMALGFIDGCFEHNINIPDELSVVSFDNISFSKMSKIGLTTVCQQVTKMGETAARLMAERIENPDAECKKIILEPELIIRNTTKRYTPIN